MVSRKKRILLADDLKNWKKKVLHNVSAKNYLFESAEDGKECLQKIRSFKPDLVILKFMLPKIHGIEILKKIKNETKIGVIIISSKVTMQDYHIAIEANADYFLSHLCKISQLFQAIENYFTGTLQPAPFKKIRTQQTKYQGIYRPTFNKDTSFIKFWGTRGSITTSGSNYTRFGGNTSCLEIRQNKELIILDAGTGIRPLGEEILKSKIKKIHLFLGHTHWDHILGFPFFEPLYDPDYEITIYAPKGIGKITKDLFSEILAYDFFPIRLDEVQAKLHFKQLIDRQPIEIGKNLKINCHFTYHPGITYCFKVEMPKVSFGYVTDNECLIGYHDHPNKIGVTNPLLEPHQSLISFFQGCDFLIHEAQYTPEEYLKKVGWGHSSIQNAAVLFKFLQVSEWIVTHHDPSHTDEILINKYRLHKKILQDCKIPIAVTYAFDGMSLAF